MPAANIDINNLILLCMAILNAFTAFLAYRTHNITKQVEIATNGMKDALVKATGDARFAEGREVGRNSDPENKQ